MRMNGCRAVAARGIGSNVSVSVIFQCAVTQFAVTQCAVIQCAVTQLLNLSLQYAITQSVISTWATQRFGFLCVFNSGRTGTSHLSKG